MNHKLDFTLEQTVYLKLDQSQRPRLITGIQLRPFNAVIYALSDGLTKDETWHYAFEINEEKDIVMSVTN